MKALAKQINLCNIGSDNFKRREGVTMKRYLLVALMVVFAAQAQASTQELIESVKQKNVPMLLELLSNGENVNGKNEQGNTALHYAVALDDAESTEALLSYGADVNAANGKGWTPLKIAEKKQVKNVAPLLAKYSSLPASQNVAEKASQAVTPEATKAVEQVENIVAQPQPVVAPKVEETVPLQKYNEDIAFRDEAAQVILNEKLQAEAKIKELEARVLQLEQEKKAAEEAKKAEAAKKVDTAKQEAIVKPVAKVAPKAPVKPVVKKPIQKLPPQKSKIFDGIYAGDEEVVYCLNYLGQGENQHFIRAAGYYAASANINEKRYNEIAGIANDYFAHAPEQAMQTRGAECSGIITPKDKKKQNQIINSINKAIGL